MSNTAERELGSETWTSYGSVEEFARQPLQWLRTLSQRHGDVAAFHGEDQSFYFAFSPDYVRQILSNSEKFHANFFAIRGGKNSAQRRLTSGLMTMNGESHKQQRRMMKPLFQKQAVLAYHNSIVDQTLELCERWESSQEWDLSDEMTRFMLQLISRILFGLNEPEHAVRVGQLTERWAELNHIVGFSAFLPEHRRNEDYEELMSTAEDLEASIRQMARLYGSQSDRNDIMSLLLSAVDDGQKMTEDQMIGQIALLFGAAHLTSSHTLTWTMFLLAQHPEIRARVETELADVLSGDVPTVEDLNRLPYLDKVLRESMRILPASAYSQRLSAEAQDFGPFKLSRGSIVIFSQIVTHHRPDLFPDPETFNPDRWDSISPSAYTYFPFGGGPRMCVGATLGTMQLKIILAILLTRFKVSVRSGSEINASVISTMLFPSNPFPVDIDQNDGVYVSHPVSGIVKTLVNLPEPSEVSTKDSGLNVSKEQLVAMLKQRMQNEMAEKNQSQAAAAAGCPFHRALRDAS